MSGFLSDRNVRPTGEILVLCHPERSEGSAFDSADALELQIPHFALAAQAQLMLCSG